MMENTRHCPLQVSTGRNTTLGSTWAVKGLLEVTEASLLFLGTPHSSDPGGCCLRPQTSQVPREKRVSFLWSFLFTPVSFSSDLEEDCQGWGLLSPPHPTSPPYPHPKPTHHTQEPPCLSFLLGCLPYSNICHCWQPWKAWCGGSSAG